MESRPAGRMATVPALLALVLLAACSSANNSKSKPTTAAPPAPSAISSPQPRPATSGVAVTPLPGSGTTATAISSVTPSPQLQTATSRLTPLFITTGDLPPALQQWSFTKPLGFANFTYVQGRPNAKQLCQQLDQDGRLGTLIASWGNGAGQQATLQTHAETALQDVLALYQSADAATSGCPFVFQGVQPSTQAPNGDVTTTTTLDIPAVGNDFKAYHVDYRYNAAGAGGGSTPARLQQVYLTACWRRGDVVATMQLGALNDEPSVDEFKQAVAAQDKKLTDAGLQ